jgi:hypothetical protein
VIYYFVCLSFAVDLVDKLIADAVAAVGKREPLTFDGGFFSPSKYRGYPSPEIDAAWDNISLGWSLHTYRQICVLT